MPNLLLILLLISLIIILLVFLFWTFRKLNLLSQVLKDNQADPGRWSFADQKLIQDAASKADSIVSQAEVMAIKAVTEKMIESELFEKNLQQGMENYFRSLDQKLLQNFMNASNQMSISMNEARKKHDQFLLQLDRQGVNWSTSMEEEMRNKLTNLLMDFEQKMTDFFSSAEQKSLDAINLEIRSARQLIDSYKTQQLKVVDENIIAVLERTLSLVLNKKLTLQDHLDLVYESLEKAKLEKFLV